MRKLLFAFALLSTIAANWLWPAGVVVLPRHWASKPPLGAQINWGHPLAAGLVDVMLMNEGSGAPYSLVQRDVSAPAGTAGAGPTWTNGQSGLARTYVAASAQHDVWINNPNRQILGALTIHAGLFCTTGNDSTQHEVISRRLSNAAGDFEWSLGIYNDGTNGPYLQSHVSGAFSTVETVGAFTPQNIFSTLSATRNPAGTAGVLYINGVSQATGSMTAPTATTNAISTGGVNGGQQAFGGNIYFVYIWNRQLGASEIRWLNADPYAFIEPPNPLSRFFTGSGTTATIRHRVTSR